MAGEAQVQRRRGEGQKQAQALVSLVPASHRHPWSYPPPLLPCIQPRVFQCCPITNAHIALTSDLLGGHWGVWLEGARAARGWGRVVVAAIVPAIVAAVVTAAVVSASGLAVVVPVTVLHTGVTTGAALVRPRLLS